MSIVDVIASVSATKNDLKNGNGYGYHYSSNHWRTYQWYLQCYGYDIPDGISSIWKSYAGDISREKLSLVVKTPGIHKIPSLNKKSDGKFSYVFFPEAGKFSIVRIYKYLKSDDGIAHIDHGLCRGKLEEAIIAQPSNLTNINTDNSELVRILKAELKLVLPYMLDEKELVKNKTFKAIIRKVKKADFIKKKVINKKKAEIIEGDYSKYTVFQDQYIPIILTAHAHQAYSENGNHMHYMGSDGSFISADDFYLPNIEGDRSKAAQLYNKLSSSNVLHLGSPSYVDTSYFGYYNHLVDIIAYDIKNKTLIRSHQIARDAYPILKKYVSENPGKFEFEFVKLVAQKSGEDFLEEANNYLKARGFGGFKVEFANAMHFHDSAQVQDWTNDSNEFGVGEWGYHYNVVISYNGKMVIGPSGRNGGWVVIGKDEDGNIRMIQSSWCQRVAKWTKATGNVDQKNADWLIEDWLAGPFAERFDIEIKEAPIVYFGNKFRKKDRKAAILQKMRAMQS